MEGRVRSIALRSVGLDRGEVHLRFSAWGQTKRAARGAKRDCAAPWKNGLSPVQVASGELAHRAASPPRTAAGMSLFGEASTPAAFAT